MRQRDSLLNLAKNVSMVLFSGSDIVLEMLGNVKRGAGGKALYWDNSKYRFVTQNPNKNSSWAERARNGDKIMWVIRLQDNKYIARVVNGKATYL